jgi:serine O-acetyltransferase
MGAWNREMNRSFLQRTSGEQRSSSHSVGCCSGIGTLLRADVAANVNKNSVALRDVVLGLAWGRGVQAALLHRLAHAAWVRGMWPISEVLLRVSQLMFGVDISYQAFIGPGLVLRHSMHVVIGNGAVLGSRVSIFHGVTIGKRMRGAQSLDR